MLFQNLECSVCEYDPSPSNIMHEPPSGVTERGRPQRTGVLRRLRRRVYPWDYVPWVVSLKLPLFVPLVVAWWEMVRKWEGYVEGMEVKKERSCMTCSSSSPSPTSSSLWSPPFSLSPSPPSALSLFPSTVRGASGSSPPPPTSGVPT